VDAAAFESELCRRLDARFADPDLAALATRDTFALYQFIDFLLPDDRQVVIETRHEGYRVAGLAFRIERR
jgi:hypothetical protein